MIDLKYTELVEWLQKPESSQAAIPDPTLDVPFRAFVANVRSVFSLAVFPGGAVYSEKLNQFLSDVVTFRKTGQLGGQVQVDITAQDMQQVYVELRSAGVLGGIKTLADAANALEYQISAEEKVRDGMLALFSSSLVGTWTAFETLAGDLWETAVNLRPKLSTGISKTVSTYLIEKYGYTVGSKMGTVMREMKPAPVAFDSLDSIRESYDKVFTDHADSIHDVLRDRSLDALAIVRNLIVHKGGRCDEEYKRRAAGLPQIPQLEVGNLLPLDGALVRALMEPGIQKCKELLHAVDRWLKAHPA